MLIFAVCLIKKIAIMFQLDYVYKQPTKLLGYQNAKTIKGNKFGYHTEIMYLSPNNQNSFRINLCQGATVGCKNACLFKAGRGKFSNVQLARLNKSEYFLRDRKSFMETLVKNITKLSKKYGNSLVIRLNGTSDIDFENISVGEYDNIFDMFPSIQFYDYTKRFDRLLNTLPSNYDITFSYAETGKNQLEAMKALEMGYNVAVVFGVKNKSKLPKTFNGYEVIIGDESDLRFLDKKNVVVGLTFKGTNADMIKAIRSGFVVKV